MRLFIFNILFILAGRAYAQESFTGTIEFKLVGFTDKKSDQPDRMTMTYGKGKLMMKAIFDNDKKEEWILLNTENDSMYSTRFSNKTYEKEALISKRNAMQVFTVTPLDSFKTFFGYRCRAHRLFMDQKTLYGYVWVTEELLGLPVKPGYRHPVFQITGAPHVMLSVEVYKNDQREGSFIPVSVTKMEQAPDSLFVLTGYVESREPGIDAMLETMNGAETSVAPAMPDTARYRKPKTTIKKKTATPKKRPVKRTTARAKRSVFIQPAPAQSRNHYAMALLVEPENNLVYKARPGNNDLNITIHSL